MEKLSKLTIRGMGCDPKSVTKETSPLALCIIYGVVTGVKQKSDINSAVLTTIFLGEFEGKNIVTGKDFVSEKMILPGGIEDAVQSKVVDGKSVRFGFQIAAVKNDSPMGYSYQASVLVSVAYVDAMSAIRAHIYASLASPATAEPTTPPPAPPPAPPTPAPPPAPPAPAPAPSRRK